MAYNVKEILEKYWAGASSLDEEKQLRAYFQQENIDPSLKPYRQMFNFFDAQQAIKMSADSQTLIENAKKQPTPKVKTRRLTTYFWRAAAAIALIIGSYVTYQQMETASTNAIVYEDTYESPEEAYAKTKEMLLLVSSKMKSGTNKAAKSVVKAQRATNILKD